MRGVRLALALAAIAALLAVAVLLLTLADTARPATAAVSCRYRAGGALPDPACTPGAMNPAVTQRTIRSTICVPGWTATVRPSSAVTGPEKRASIARYGRAFGSWPGAYEYDHLVSLELGGAPNDLRNLWPEPRNIVDGSPGKDIVENRLHGLVCAGRMTLARARYLIRRDWRRAR